MKSLIFPVALLVAVVAAFIFWPDKTPPPCITKGSITSLPWLECK